MRILFLIIAVLLISGCSSDEKVDINDETNATYDGTALTIGVIGEKLSKNVDNITFDSVEPSALKEEEDYDAYFITEPYFEELSRDSWVSVFSNSPIPVFFINLDVQAFIYRVEGMGYDDTSPKATEHTKGFVRTGDTIKSWGYGDPSKATKVDTTPEWIFNEMYRDIENYVANDT
ncbi:hypothetical protein D7Z54_26410 [Salibacterium salarium]|uniref:Lipoprotein n=1 Tax=Salibacterium salarium TaxID=284579 RepID=A0A428MW16_9BACI|nr:hypothetical protein [Salibacterium salarium]RSL30375.1 hypothetical protein D7Z54_26410 [Salibacterium salarium]